jgi:hypothetical protein
MNKYPCGLIEDLIPLYIEGDISEDTKEIVEMHLKECKNCSNLFHEYNDVELNLENLKEDLPKADTFKSWMNKLKIWGIITAAAAIFAFISIGTIGYKIGDKPENDILTTRTIVKTFEKQGLPLKEDSSRSLVDFILSGVKPTVFSLDQNNGTLLIYTFNSFVERDNIIKESNRFDKAFSMKEIPYKAKNALIVFLTAKTPETEEDLTKLSKTLSMISNIVFKNLNDGKEIIYKGQSSNWEGTFTLKYYEHWWQDEKGTLHHESYHDEYPIIKYKPSDVETVGSIEFEYKTTSGGGNSENVELDKDGYLKLGGNGSNGAIPSESDNITYVIKWNNKEESFLLKAQ